MQGLCQGYLNPTQTFIPCLYKDTRLSWVSESSDGFALEKTKPTDHRPSSVFLHIYVDDGSLFAQGKQIRLQTVLSKDCRYIVLLLCMITVKGKSGIKALQQQHLSANMRTAPPPFSGSAWKDQAAPQCWDSLGATTEYLRHSSSPLLERVLRAGCVTFLRQGLCAAVCLCVWRVEIH